MISMKKVISKKDDFLMLTFLSFLSKFRDLSKSTGVICSVVGVKLLSEHGSFAVTGNEIFVFEVSVGKMSYSSPIWNVQEM